MTRTGLRRMTLTRPAEMRPQSMARGGAKAAELASGLGAIVLGGGLALLLPAWMREHAVLMTVVGAGVHGVGMSLKYALEHPDGSLRWWERALFWGCWAALLGLGLWLAAFSVAR